MDMKLGPVNLFC